MTSGSFYSDRKCVAGTSAEPGGRRVSCELCNEAVGAGDLYIELDGLIICIDCLDSLTARELAVEVLNNKITAAG